MVAVVVFVEGMMSAGSSAVWNGPKPTIVLVHGAWADGSSWHEVSDRLLRDGFEVRVPPNNLRGVQSDAADLAAYLSTIDGPIVLVAHSYGGAVITNAAAGNDQVRALVYVNAFIPDEGETLAELNKPPSVFAQDPAKVFDFVPLIDATDGAADIYVKPSVYGPAFANEGFTAREIGVLAAAQRPLSTRAFGEPTTSPAWVTIPSWAVVGTEDEIIPARDQRAMAKTAGATITEVDAAHLSMLTADRIVARVIVQAAKGS
jgi:pimeloyl-ACP methyl ester carboxylesterase